MKKFISLLTLIGLGLLQIHLAEPTFAHDENLIANPSVEESYSDGTPVGWGEGYNWGDVDITYTYENSGHNSNKSLKAEVTRHTSGDAKWYFWPVDVKASTNYELSNFYKASVPTQTVIEAQDTNGNYSYHWLGENATKSDWTKASYSFTTPALTNKITILHTVGQVGWVNVDDFFLGEKHEHGNTNDNLAPNQSVEQASLENPNVPGEWNNNNWGSNNPTFSYVNEGQHGNRSVKVTMNNHQDGDAKWYFAPQPVEGGHHYEVTDYYKSDVTTRVVLWVTQTDGSNAYLEMKTAAASPNQWAHYRDTVTLPAGAILASVFHLIDRNGFLVTDNITFKQGSISGFNRPIVSLTFDDGWEANYLTALPLMQQYGMVSTQFYATTFINENDPESINRIRLFQNAGHEIGSHTVTHPDLTQLSPSEVDYELRESKALLERNFGPIKNFSSPFGAANDSVIDTINDYYVSHRGVNAGYNSKDNFDIYRLKVQNILSTTTRQEVENWVLTAKEQKLWLVLVYHKVEDQNVGPYDSTPAQLESHLQEIAENSVHVATTQQAIDEIRPQL